MGINLNVPIFSGFSTTYRVRSAEAQVEAKNAQLEQVHLQVALDVWTAYQNLTTATQSLRTTAVLLDSAEQSARVALGRYKAGVGSILDVLNAQSALASARQQRIQSTFNWNISRATLAQSMGSLDASLLQTLSDRNARQPGESKSGRKSTPENPTMKKLFHSPLALTALLQSGSLPASPITGFYMQIRHRNIVPRPWKKATSARPCRPTARSIR